jgi:quercetin dioxygenase-like cupin family protein
MAPSPVAAFAVAPGAGLAVENPAGDITTFKAMADLTGGALTVVEGVAAPGQGPPLHVHREQDEILYTLDGRFRIRLDDDVHDAPAGTFAFIPRGTPHTWQNVGDAPARFLAALMPAATGFEQFFVRYAELPRDQRDLAAFAPLSGEPEAMDVVGAPLAESHDA